MWERWVLVTTPTDRYIPWEGDSFENRGNRYLYLQLRAVSVLQIISYFHYKKKIISNSSFVKRSTTLPQELDFISLFLSFCI